MAEGNINKFLNLVNELPGIKYDGQRYIVSEEYRQKVEELKVEFDEFGDSLHLKVKSFLSGDNVKYYESLESEIKSLDIATPILLVSASGLVIKYNPEDCSFVEYGSKNEEALLRFRNIISYFKLFNFLKANTFCDYYNDADNEIVFYSSVNGIIRVKYSPIPSVTSSGNIMGKVENLIILATPIQVSPFFKNAIFTISKGTGIIKMQELIDHADDINTITRRDYELVSKQFNFEKFKDSLYKEKEKYFFNIREIVSKIFSQAVGIPISISASVFATYKVSDDIFMLFLVLIAFGLYTAFYIKIQCIYKTDLSEIEKDFFISFNIISSQSGLNKEVIDLEKNKIISKIRSTKNIIRWLIITVTALGLLVVAYIAYEIIWSEAFSLVKHLLQKE